MKKLFALTVIFTLVLAGCDLLFSNKDKTESVIAETNLPSLTIWNESSFDLTDVKFKALSFSASGSNDLPRNSKSVQKLAANDVGKAGYITFTRKDIGIDCRTEEITIIDDYTFTFYDDSTRVQEQGNSNNKGTLAQITFLSQVAVVHNDLPVAKNDDIPLGEMVINNLKENQFTITNTGTGKLLFKNNEPIKITNDTDGVFSVVQPSRSEIATNASLPFKIKFAPKAVQTYTATVTITSNDKNSPYTFTISAKGTPPKPIAVVIYENDEILQNGTINAGETYITLSESITVTIKNDGTETLAIDTANITITGADAAAFIKTTSPGGSVSAGGKTTSFFIECKPVKEGINQAVLTIPTNDEARNPVTVFLKITGKKGTPVPELSQGTKFITNNTLTPVDFETVEVGASKTLTFTIKNTGNIALELSGEPIVASSNAVFAVSTQPANKTINPGNNVSFVIRYTPLVEGEVTANITIEDNTNGGQFVFPVKGTGYVKKPKITILYGNGDNEIIQNGTIDAGDVLFTLSTTITVTIKNTGEIPLTIDTANITITGTDAEAFTKTNPNVSIQAGNQSTFTIKCEPLKVGQNNAVLTIPSNDTLRSPAVVNLRVTGVQGYPVVALTQGTATIANNSLTPVDFGTVELGNSKGLNFAIKNTGNIALNLTGSPIVSSSNSIFTVISQPPNTTLNPAASAQFSIQYTPTSEGEVTGTITITNNSEANPYTFKVKGNGYVKKPQIKIYYGTNEIIQNGTIDSGDTLFTLSKTITVTIKNTGEIPLAIDTANITITGTDSAAFTKTTNPDVNIQAGASSTFNIKCEPLKVGQNDAVLTIPSNDTLRNPAVVNLKVNGVQGYPVMALTQGTTTIANNSLTPVDFGTVEKGTSKSLNFSIKNNGNIALNLTGSPIVSSSNSAFTVSSQPASATLNPAATTAFSIQYTPTVGGAVTGTITIANNSEGSPFTFNVKGNSTIPAPTGVTAVSQSPGNIYLTWNAVSVATSYKVYYGTSSTAITSLASGAVIGTSYTHTGLSDGTTYYYNITAQDAGTESNRSQTVSMLTLPGIPGNLRNTVTTYNSNTIAWDSVTGATSYKVYYAATIEGSKTLAGTVSGISYNHISLAANTTRYYFVTAVNNTGEGSYTDALSVRTLLAPLSKPNNVTATALSKTSIQVTWDTVTGATNYKVYRATSATGTKTLLDTVTTTSYTNSGLSAVTYWYFVTTLNMDNVESAFSDSASMVPMPDVPSNVKAKGSAGSVSTYIDWDSVSGASSYKIYYATSSTGNKTLVGTSTNRYYEHAGTANATYYYWVTAVNAAGESDYSLQVSAMTPPAAPMNLRVTATTTSSITIAWDAVTGATQYSISFYYLDAYLRPIREGIGTQTGTTRTITGLYSKEEYTLLVDATNSGGSYGPTASITATTK